MSAPQQPAGVHVPTGAPGVQVPQSAPSPSAPNGAAPQTTTGFSRPASERAGQPLDISIQDLLGAVLQLEGSDLHLPANRPAKIRVHGKLRDLSIGGRKLQMNPEQTEKMLLGMLTAEQQKTLEETHELDFAYEIPGLQEARFRGNVFYAAGQTLQGAFRLIPNTIRTLDELNLPEAVRKLCFQPRGLVLVCGPTGSGKSTTLAAMIDEINRARDCHILTIEDPVEYLHKPQRALITQRELGTDTYSFHAALKSALRQDPDVILVGEMRDPETIALGIEAAETGHLVFGTLHSQDAAQTMDRIIQSFPAAQQSHIQSQLSLAMQGVVCQQLVPTVNGKGRIAATEIMLGTSAIRSILRKGETNQIYSTLMTSVADGMRTMDISLAEMMAKGLISRQAAEAISSNPGDLPGIMQTYSRRMAAEAAGLPAPGAPARNANSWTQKP